MKYFISSPAYSVADVVISCALVEEGGMGKGGAFSKTPATLVLRDVAVDPDESDETVTPFVPPSEPNPDDIIIEAKGFPGLYKQPVFCFFNIKASC